ncbi:MAG: radical SAM protein [Candidatus Lokiarchaeota archaeon]|nr:radical SAM protein [Candidatus Lokiarchaeota archaeon]MBD3201541.1 radical SAM protein [Candidatus Lokiarchaeota archaeon]
MNSFNEKFLERSKYQQKINRKITQCLICERKCKIKKGKTGFCGTRINIDNELYSTIYGNIPLKSVNSIEKKPFYHFHPGTEAYTIGTYGCNFTCFWCQNHNLSHPKTPVIDIIKKEKNYLSPEGLIENAKRNQCEGVSISFNEPTLLFEYALKVFKLAKKTGIYTNFVSNGYMTEKVAYDLIDFGLDAINIDIKGNSELVRKYCGADIEKIWRNAKLFVENGVHLELTTLLIEEFNATKKIINDIIKRVIDNLGKSIPLHFTRAYPCFNSNDYGFN